VKRRKEEVALAKDRERREKAVAKAQAAIQDAKREMTSGQAQSKPRGQRLKNGRRRRTRAGENQKEKLELAKRTGDPTRLMDVQCLEDYHG